MPAEFHSAKAFDYALSIGRKALGNSAVLEDGGIDAPLLLLGLMYREVSRAMEIEPEATSNVPIHLQESPFGIKDCNRELNSEGSSFIKAIGVLSNGLGSHHSSFFLSLAYWFNFYIFVLHVF